MFCNEFLLDFVAANNCVYFQCLFMHFVCANIFGAIVLKPRFKIDVVIMIICRIVIIINSVLTLQVSIASLPQDCGPYKGCVHPHLIRFIPAFASGRIGCAYA